MITSIVEVKTQYNLSEKEFLSKLHSHINEEISDIEMYDSDQGMRIIITTIEKK